MTQARLWQDSFENYNSDHSIQMAKLFDSSTICVRFESAIASTEMCEGTLLNFLKGVKAGDGRI